MNNYEAIMKMSKQQLEKFLDGVYCTGINDGMYALRLSEEKAIEILDQNPFNMEWLSDNAEEAVLNNESVDEDGREMLDALTIAVMRNVGLDDSSEDNSDSKGNVVVF